MAASTSTAANPTCYDVFINHRGPDTKKTLASHLYRRLLSHGLRVFLDQKELQEGDSITSQIEGAIQTASVHVAIFSARYAESNWCLNELLLMLESKAPLIPVFYHVKPTELRWTRVRDGGYIAEALHNLEKKKTHEDKLRYSSNTIQNWRNALSRVADISGFTLDAYNGDEGELVDKVVERVLKKVKKPALDVAKYPTGLEEKVKDFENTLLLQKEHKPQILGIVGLGGVGKTTLVKEFFNIKNSDYLRSCFLSDVRDTTAKGSLTSLQRKLLKSLTGLDNPIDNVDEGIQLLRKHLSSSKALIILDDVDHVNQVDALLPVRTILYSDSLILITSRNRDVLTSSRVEESSIYNLSGLNTRQSLELFCMHSFNQPHPLPGFECLTDKFLKACDGLPLSLIVFGALLHWKNDRFYWEDQLHKLQRILPSEIKQRLQISYESLDAEEQQIFLDIACFFIGQNKETAIRIWNGSGWKGRLGFHNLQNKCIVKVDYRNNIQMHDHFRDLGREIAKDSMPRRLWDPRENINDSLPESSVITVRGIKMVLGEYNDKDNALYDEDEDDAFGGIIMRRLQLVDTEYDILESIWRRVKSPNLIWLRWSNCPYSSLPFWIPLKSLWVLEVGGSSLETLWQRDQVPLQLRELEIFAPLSEIPKSVGKLKHLEQIILSYGKVYGEKIIPDCRKHLHLKNFPEEFCDLQSLKALVLKGCSKLKSLPKSFGNLTNLQHLELSDCSDLKRLPNSFGDLIKLKYLSLRNCSNLTISRETLGNISTLQYINLYCCKKMKVLPPQVAHQRSLEHLDVRGTKLKELPSAIGELSHLEVLQLGSPLLDTLPPSLRDLQSLKELKLENCKELKCLPSFVELLTQLTELIVYRCPLREVPFKQVKGERRALRTLDSSIDKCMPGLQYLSLIHTEISDLSFGEGVCSNLQHLRIESCYNLVEVGTLPNTIIKLELSNCNSLRKIEGLCGLVKLQKFSINGCKEVQELSIETLIFLEELQVGECEKMKSIQGLAQLTKIRLLNVYMCSDLKEMPGIQHLMYLEKLRVFKCPKLQWNSRVMDQFSPTLEGARH